MDIDYIEPLEKFTFMLQYHDHEVIEQGGGGLFSSKKPVLTQKSVIIQEHYQSRHLAEILNAYTLILETIEKEEKDLGGMEHHFN